MPLGNTLPGARRKDSRTISKMHRSQYGFLGQGRKDARLSPLERTHEGLERVTTRLVKVAQIVGSAKAIHTACRLPSDEVRPPCVLGLNRDWDRSRTRTGGVAVSTPGGSCTMLPPRS